MVYKPINFLTFNVRSIVDRSRQIELSNTLYHNNIDIGFIQECHLRGNRRANLAGYNFLYDYSPVGVAIAVKRGVQYKRININNTEFYGTFCQIEVNLNCIRKKFLIGSIYIPCNFSMTKIYEGLNNILRAAEDYDGFILGGDLNAKNPAWGDSTENTNGKVLHNWIQDNILEVGRVCDTAPSYPNGASFLDHFLVSQNVINLQDPNYKVTSLSTFSDHFPIKIQLEIDSTDLVLRSPRLYTSYKNTNWDNFSLDLDDALLRLMPSINRNLQNFEIDELLNIFIAKLATVHDTHSEKIERNPHKPPLSESIKKFYKIKHCWQKNLKKIYHRTGNRLSSEYNILSKQIQLLKKIIKELVNLDEAKKFNNKLEKIKPGPTAFKEIHKMVGKKKSSSCQKITHNNITTTNNAEIAEIFQNYYSVVYCEKQLARPTENFDVLVPSYINDIPPHIYSFDTIFNALENPDKYHFTDVGTVRAFIYRLNNKKSHGVDEISNFLIKKFPITALKFLTVLFNNCLNNCYFPAVWKSAKIIPIKKKNNSDRPEDFRPISLLSNVGKIFELILKEKLENDMIIDPISSFQFGFKRFHSTQHALLKFHSDLTNKLRDKTCTVAVSLDIEKAFDSANHNGILYKLADLGIDPFLVKLFQNFFTDRKFCVQIEDSTSGFDLVKSGVPQGSVLAPFLFNIFLHDFPHQLEDSKAILYADDCMIYAHDVSPSQALQKAAFHLGLISTYYKSWGIKINASKSEAICIRNASGKCAKFVVPQSKCLQLSLDGIEIPFKSNIKYLGVKFDKLLKFNNNARSLLEKTKRIAGMFSGLMNNKYLPQRTKLLIYKVAIRSVLVYGFPIWFSISPSVAKEIEIFERKFLRKCINKHYKNATSRYSNTYVYTKSDVQPFCTYALSLQKKFVDNLQFHDNVLLNEIFLQEVNTNWTRFAYLSPVGILHENLDNNLVPEALPDFYKKTTSGSHRG